jgi:DNA invertase Pin-like site-specific DNA recombinase
MDQTDQPKIICYLRVSTKPQATDDKTGYKRQEQACRDYAAQYNLNIDEVHKEPWTGTDAKRPVFYKLLQTLPKGSTILVESMDRFTRSTIAGLPLLLDVIANGLNLIDCSTGETINEALNGTAWQRLLVRMRMVISEFEKDHIAERLNKARTIKSYEAGHYIAAQKPKYTKEFREDLRQKIEDGCTLTEIAKFLNDQNIRTASGRTWTPHLVAAVAKGGPKKDFSQNNNNNH